MTCKGVVVLNQPVVDVYNCEPSSYQNSSQSLVSCVCVMGWFTELHYAFGECACVLKFFLVHIWRGNRGGNKLKDKLVHDPLVSGKIGPYKNSISFRTHTHTHQWRNVLTVSLLRCSAMTRNTPSIPVLNAQTMQPAPAYTGYPGPSHTTLERTNDICRSSCSCSYSPHARWGLLDFIRAVLFLLD